MRSGFEVRFLTFGYEVPAVVHGYARVCAGMGDMLGVRRCARVCMGMRLCFSAWVRHLLKMFLNPGS